MINKKYEKCKHWYHMLDWNHLSNSDLFLKLPKEIQNELMGLGFKKEKW